MARRNDFAAIGKAKTAIVSQTNGEAVAIITEIFAQATQLDSHSRFEFRGPVKLDDKTLHHIESVLLPIVDQITQSLKLPKQNFLISISNIGAAATKGKGIKLSGFSADLPIFLALLSASLQVALRQDIVATGHIASLAGDAMAVLDIPLKIDAAAASGDIKEFLLPKFDEDRSVSLLMSHDELIRAKESIYKNKARIILTTIENIHGAIRSFILEDAIVTSALTQGFFDTTPEFNELGNPVKQSVQFLLEDNEKRFWNAVEDCLLEHEVAATKSFIRSFIDFNLGRKRYPQYFGERLHRLTMSLPPLTRRLDGLFPIVSIDQCIALSQYAKKTDHDDVQNLYKLTSLDNFAKKMDTADKEETASGETDQEGKLLREILFELSDSNLARKVSLALDEARACYPMSSVTVKDAFEFNQAVTSFYIHLMRHTQSPEGHVSWDAATSEALDRIEDSFRDQGGYNAALAEAKTGTKGGLRYVFDVMADSEKSIKMGKYMTMVLKEAIDSLDWEAKVKLSMHIKKQYSQYLTGSFRAMQPEQLSHRLEDVIRLLSKGESAIDRWISRY